MHAMHARCLPPCARVPRVPAADAARDAPCAVVVVGMMHMIAGLMLAQMVPPTKAVPATSTSKDMYDFWCTPARMSSILCQHHDLIAKMGAAKVRPNRRPVVSTAAVAPHSEHGEHGERGEHGGHSEHPIATAAAPPPLMIVTLPRPTTRRKGSQRRSRACSRRRHRRRRPARPGRPRPSPRSIHR